MNAGGSTTLVRLYLATFASSTQIHHRITVSTSSMAASCEFRWVKLKLGFLQRRKERVNISQQKHALVSESLPAKRPSFLPPQFNVFCCLPASL